MVIFLCLQLIQTTGKKTSKRRKIFIYAVSQSPKANFISACTRLNGTTKTISGTTYTVQSAYLYGTSCYAISLEGMKWDTAQTFCSMLHPNMHLGMLSVRGEFDAANLTINHVNVYNVYYM
jgi:hypothetical protein